MEARRNAAAGTEFGWKIRLLGIPAPCAPQHNVSSRFSTLLEGFASPIGTTPARRGSGQKEEGSSVPALEPSGRARG